MTYQVVVQSKRNRLSLPLSCNAGWSKVRRNIANLCLRPQSFFSGKSKNGLLPLESDPYSYIRGTSNSPQKTPNLTPTMIPASAIRDTIAPATFFIFILLAILFCSSREGEGGGDVGGSGGMPNNSRISSLSSQEALNWSLSTRSSADLPASQHPCHPLLHCPAQVLMVKSIPGCARRRRTAWTSPALTA